MTYSFIVYLILKLETYSGQVLNVIDLFICTAFVIEAATDHPLLDQHQQVDRIWLPQFQLQYQAEVALIKPLDLFLYPVLDYLHFLELGVTPGVQRVFLPPVDDGVSSAIGIPGEGFPFGSSIQRNVYVRSTSSDNTAVDR